VRRLGGSAALRYSGVATSLSIRFDVWVAALGSGYGPHSLFVTWADRMIDRDAHQPRWVLDLSLSKDAKDAERVLRLEWARQSEFPANEAPALNEPGNLHVGFLYLRFGNGSLSMAELLSRAGIYTDGHGYDCVDEECEAFFYLLNEIDGGGPTIKSDRPLAERVDELFAPFASAARATLPQLPGDPAAE
jgi:hypothetical protein